MGIFFQGVMKKFINENISAWRRTVLLLFHNKESEEHQSASFSSCLWKCSLEMQVHVVYELDKHRWLDIKVFQLPPVACIME